MTPLEFRQTCAGYLWRREREEDQMATLLSTLARLHGNKVSASQMLGVHPVFGFRRIGASHVPWYREWR